MKAVIDIHLMELGKRMKRTKKQVVGRVIKMNNYEFYESEITQELLQWSLISTSGAFHSQKWQL